MKKPANEFIKGYRIEAVDKFSTESEDKGPIEGIQEAYKMPPQDVKKINEAK
ncbi:hypothetical protein [Evansella cellulosilytica]|uniref:Uncharacterized protein n=1 Tax=Evansella cellulosilytica (strain ATCC 21833 / DSM 2522 / FERM P-1141 / JCM 9156 / N-4) TaxID=649639 RepID=E6TQR4_EVAC2|nr:hypothetical protein [Evansella cellulosilytica]ADU31689.1 hypothetical protein Bcell_3447 [Evansella cellulosilytica DSM 2522]